MKKIKIITHNGHFHADDVFAVALLSIVIKEPYEVIRTRDPEIITTGDYVVDVGDIYDEDKNLFDHHQVGGAGKRSNTIPYSSFGLVWKKFGEEVCRSKEVAEVIEKRLVLPIDALDNGVNIYKKIFSDINPYSIGDMIESFSLSLQEKDRSFNEAFMEALEVAKKILDREILKAKGKISGQKVVEESYKNSEDKRLIILEGHYSWKSVLVSKSEPLYVIYPAESNDGRWHVRAVPTEEKSFDNRKDFPSEWAGKRDQELAKTTGVEDAVFCHNGLFIAVTKSKEGAIELAKKALEA